jgi:glycine betaine transporter
MRNNLVLTFALVITSAIAFWGIWDTKGLLVFASWIVNILFESRGWFIMLTVSTLTIVCLWLIFSPYGRIKLGQDDEEPEFSTISWLTMLFAAGMGVGLLYWGSAEPISHYLLISEKYPAHESALLALFVTNFHWGIHAWSIYAIMGLVIAYFTFRRKTQMLVSAPISKVFGNHIWTRIVCSISDLSAIVAIAIGVGGSIAMGIFQVQGGVENLFEIKSTGANLGLIIFSVLFIAYILPLMVDLNRGMAVISKINMLGATLLMLFVLLAGPTHYLMSAIIESFGEYASRFLQHGFRTFTFGDLQTHDWFKSWTLTFMVWFLAWAPFVGVFIARISRGRTIREFILCVIFIPTLFSIFWFGVFGGTAFHEILNKNTHLLEVVKTDVNSTIFVVLESLPMGGLTSSLTILIAFLFIVTSVVSAAYVLSMFSTGGNLVPSIKIKLVWGVILGALGVVMILSGSIEAVRAITALWAMPFVFIILLLMVCLLKDLKREAKNGYR